MMDKIDKIIRRAGIEKPPTVEDTVVVMMVSDIEKLVRATVWECIDAIAEIEDDYAAILQFQLLEYFNMIPEMK